MPCRILHTTDFHFGYFPGENDDVVVQEPWQADLGKNLREQIKVEIINILNDYERKPNLWVLTGDFTNKQLSSGFKLFAEWFNEIIVKTNFPREDVVFVPGNHDTTGCEYFDGDEVLLTLDRMREERSQYPNDLSIPLKSDAFKLYRDFLLKCGLTPPAHIVPTRVEYDGVRPRSSTAKLHFLAINSAGLSATAKVIPNSTKPIQRDIFAEGGLWVRENWPKRTEEEPNANNVSILAVHHPKYWWSWRDRYRGLGSEGTYGKLAAHVDIVLLGHNHPAERFQRNLHPRHFPLCALPNFGGAMHIKFPVAPNGAATKEEAVSKRGELFNNPEIVMFDLLEISPSKDSASVETWLYWMSQVVAGDGGNEWVIEKRSSPKQDIKSYDPHLRERFFAIEFPEKLADFQQQEKKAYPTILKLWKSRSLVEFRIKVIDALAVHFGLAPIPGDDPSDYQARRVAFQKVDTAEKIVEYWDFMDLIEYEDELGMQLSLLGRIAKGRKKLESEQSKWPGYELNLVLCPFDYYNCLIEPESLLGCDDYFRIQYLLERTIRFQEYILEDKIVSHTNFPSKSRAMNPIYFLSRENVAKILHHRTIEESSEMLQYVEEIESRFKNMS